MPEDKVLSQDEMDALLDSVSSEDSDGESTGGPGATVVHPYNFQQPAHRLNARLPGLDTVNERFSQNLQSILSGLVHRTVEVSATDFVMRKYADYINSLPVPTSTHYARVAPMNGVALLSVDAKLVFMMVDCYFGGRGLSSDMQMEREFTPAENRMVTRLLQEACRELQTAWQPVTELVFDVLPSHERPNALKQPEPDEILVINKFQVELPSGSSDFHIAMPYSLLDALRPVLTSGVPTAPTESNGEWKDQLAARVLQSKVEIKSLFTEAQISVGDLMNLKPGDVIPIAVEDTVVVQAEDVSLFDASVGVSNGAAAAKLIGRHRNISAPSAILSGVPSE